jgi:hypothetical protein
MKGRASAQMGVFRPWLGDVAWQASLHEQLADELERIRLYVLRHIDWLRQRSGRWPLAGIGPSVVTDEEALAGLAGIDPVAHASFIRTSERNGEIESIDGALSERSRAMAAKGTPFPIDELSTAFGLERFVRDTLMLALAPDLDPALSRALAYAQDDAGARHATPALAMALFGGHDRAAAKSNAFGPTGSFARLAFLESTDLSDAVSVTRPLRVDARVAWFLRGVDDPRTPSGLQLEAVSAPAVPHEYAESASLAAAALGRGAASGSLPAVNLVGAHDRSARALASAIAARAGLALHAIAVEPAATSATMAGLIATLDREAALRGTAYLIETGDDELGPAAQIADLSAGLVIVASRHPIRIQRPLVTVTPARPLAASRRDLWLHALGRVDPDVSESLPEVVHHFDLDPESIARVAATAVGHARLRGDTVSRGDLWQACRAFGRRRLGGLAERIESEFGWEDIVLPPVARTQLEEICAQVKHRPTVYDDWDFSRRLPRGRGVTALFAGPSGTGKTMAAEVLARELELDLYRIDLAGVVNKYIGETEKNLRRIFAAAEESGAILFFDEADALFGKRTDVRDSHDRYANIEIDYLLQRMEAYTGLAILATNRKAALDRAFLRRLRFLVDFPFPAADLRLRIWQKALPASAPTRAIDFGALARLDLAGGSIQSVALNAAFLAAADGRVITMDHLTHAASREYAKLDKVATDAEFGGMAEAVAS